MTSSEAEQFKTLGNEAFSTGRFEEAIKHFSDAIELDPSNHVLFSNRSAARASLKDYEEALEDADHCITLKPDWSKGYGRKGAALLGLGDLEEAKAAYSKGLEIEPANMQLKKGLEACEQTPLQSFKSPFADPSVLVRLAGNPKTAAYLSQPDFMTMLEEMQRDPKALSKYMGDKRIMESLGVILGFDLNMPEHPKEGFSESPSSSAANVPKPAKTPEEPVSQVPMTLEDENKKRAMEEKELGNAAYKRHEFEEAMQRYKTAFGLDPSNVSLLNNQAAVLFETGAFEECIKVCEQAVDHGRDIRADYTLIAKALGRMGSAYIRLDDLDQAIKYLNKSLTEHRTPEILAKLKETEKLYDARVKEAYHNPELAEQARSQGNELFKQGNWPEALKHYTESIKRDEKDPRGYSNRAACYTKLMAVAEGLRDCEMCLKLDPTFVKGYIRKANLLFMKKDYSEALVQSEKAMTLDHEHKNSVEIQQLMSKIYNGINAQSQSMTPEEAMRKAQSDPELKSILSDPSMRHVLQQMQTDPKAASEFMRDPTIAANIRKLVAAGIVRTA